MNTREQLEQAYEAVATEFGRTSPEAMLARVSLLSARNEAAKEAGELYLEPVRRAVSFEPNDPDPRLLRGKSTVLLLNPHFDDNDNRLVCLRWQGCAFATFSPPNDEGVARSRLGGLGLGLWPMVEAGNSPLVTYFAELTGVSQLRHFICLLKDKLFQAVATDYEVFRIEREQMRDVNQALSLIASARQESIYEAGR
jgi:hypothetical protein